MQNSKLKRQIEYEMSHVPRLGNGWRYIPLHKLPKGTQITIKTTNNFQIDDEEEHDILRLPEGCYQLQIAIWPSVCLTFPNGSSEYVKPIHNFLAPTSIFAANVDRKGEEKGIWAITFRLTTGQINDILISGTQFTLSKDDGQKSRKSHKSHKSRKRRIGHKPLRQRWRY